MLDSQYFFADKVLCTPKVTLIEEFNNFLQSYFSESLSIEQGALPDGIISVLKFKTTATLVG